MKMTPTQKRAMKPTKDQVKGEIVALLNRSTTQHCADKIYQKLRQHHRAWALDRDSIYRWVPELAADGRITCLGPMPDGEHETTVMYAAIRALDISTITHGEKA